MSSLEEAADVCATRRGDAIVEDLVERRFRDVVVNRVASDSSSSFCEASESRLRLRYNDNAVRAAWAAIEGGGLCVRMG